MPRLNYTGRKKIFRHDISITVFDNTGILSFDADFKTDNYKLPEDAEIFIEAYRQAVWMRFPYGTVKDHKQPENRRLSDFDSLDGILFRVKITQSDGIHGKLLAIAERIKPRKPEDEDENRECILPARSLEMDCLWRIDFSDDRPVLLISKQAGSKDAICRSKEFISLVYPAAFREILCRLLTDQPDDSDDMDNWRCQWREFIKILPGIDDLPDPSETNQHEEWLDGAVDAFSRSQNVLDIFTSYWQDKE